MRAYFPKENLGDLLVDRHRIKIPTLGWVRLIKEKGYIPVNAKVKSCNTHPPNRPLLRVLLLWKSLILR
jgi:putative transposase